MEEKLLTPVKATNLWLEILVNVWILGSLVLPFHRRGLSAELWPEDSSVSLAGLRYGRF